MGLCFRNSLNVLRKNIYMHSNVINIMPQCAFNTFKIQCTKENNIKFSPITNYSIRTYSKKVQDSTSKLNELASNLESGSKKKTLEGGVVISDIKVGSGTIAKSGKTISVYYSGKLKSTNKVFDEVIEGPGLTFRLGRGDVIDGWDIGVMGMKVGGKRIIACPPAMAYGVKGFPPVIPPNSTLIFEVELKGVE